jgi:hypothetical protein
LPNVAVGQAIQLNWAKVVESNHLLATFDRVISICDELLLKPFIKSRPIVKIVLYFIITGL